MCQFATRIIASIFPHEIQYMPTKRQMLLLYTGVPSRGCVMEWCPPYVRLSMRFWLITSERKVLETSNLVKIFSFMCVTDSPISGRKVKCQGHIGAGRIFASTTHIFTSMNIYSALLRWGRLTQQRNADPLAAPVLMLRLASQHNRCSSSTMRYSSPGKPVCRGSHTAADLLLSPST